MQLEEFLRLLSADDPDDRVRALGWAESEPLVSATLLATALRDERAVERAKVWGLIAVGRLGPSAKDAVRSTVLQRLRDPSPAVRRAAISALVNMRDQSALEAIAGLLNDHSGDDGAWFEDDATVSQAAAAAIAKLSSAHGAGAGTPMIGRDAMMAPMLVACPSFEPRWQAFLAEWSNETEPPVYLALADLARHAVSLLEANEDSTLVRVFEVVERWQVEGDQYVREAATIGFFEDLQNDNLHTTTTPGQFEPFLLAESRRAWSELLAFWRRR